MEVYLSTFKKTRGQHPLTFKEHFFVDSFSGKYMVCSCLSRLLTLIHSIFTIGLDCDEIVFKIKIYQSRSKKS